MRKTLAHEIGLDARKSNDIYDLYLVDIGSNEVQLIIYMKILFTFAPGKDASGAAVDWKKGEPEKFVADWRLAVASAWTSKRYTQHKGIFISIHVSFDIKIGDSYPGSHWQIMVEKLPTGSTGKTSFVWRDQMKKKYDVQLDSLDNQKKTGLADGTQTGAIHEFGHMLGLGDEYGSHGSEEEKKDTNSIMNSGSAIRARHYHSLLQWAKKKIDLVKKQIDATSRKPADSSVAPKYRPFGTA